MVIVERGPASKVMSKLHEHSVLTFHKILTSRRVLEGEDRQAQTEQARSTLGLGFSLSLWAMTYGHSSGLLPLEAPVMIAEKRKLFFHFFLQMTIRHDVWSGHLTDIIL